MKAVRPLPQFGPWTKRTIYGRMAFWICPSRARLRSGRCPRAQGARTTATPAAWPGVWNAPDYRAGRRPLFPPNASHDKVCAAYTFFERPLAFYGQKVFIFNFWEDISRFCGATDTPVLDFWWTLSWVSKPEWAELFTLGGGVHVTLPVASFNGHSYFADRSLA